MDRDLVIEQRTDCVTPEIILVFYTINMRCIRKAVARYARSELRLRNKKLERDVDAVDRPEYVQVSSIYLFTLVMNATRRKVNFYAYGQFIRRLQQEIKIQIVHHIKLTSLAITTTKSNGRNFPTQQSFLF